MACPRCCQMVWATTPHITKIEGGGAVFDLAQPGSVASSLRQLQAILAAPDHRVAGRELARRHRSLEPARAAYGVLLKAMTDVSRLVIAW